MGIASAAPGTPPSEGGIAIPLRSSPEIVAGANPFDALDLTSDVHYHDLHQILYAFQGIVEVEANATHYFLPPQRALWIPAGLRHQTTFHDVRTMSIFFDASLIRPRDQRARVLVVSPLFREMIVYAGRWPIDRDDNEDLADAYFTALSKLVDEWIDFETPFSLPTSNDPLVAGAMRYTAEHLSQVVIRDVSDAVGVSERTLRRRFQAVAGMTWQQYLLQARLLRAMSQLAVDRSSVAHVAAAVGFDSASGFTRAFTRYTGDTPTEYRNRALASLADAQ